MRGQTIFHGVNRNLKHISLVVCISAAGEHMRPFLVSSLATDAVETRFKQMGFRMGADLILRKRSKPYMSAELFDEYISTVLLPYIEELLSNDEFADREAVLLMANCSVHNRSAPLRKLADHRVNAITFSPHTTYVFQSLDLSIFGTFKKRMSDQLPFDNDETSAGSIRRFFHNAKQTLVEDNARSGFLKLGLSCDIGTTPYLLLFDEGMLRESHRFLALWERDCPLENMSARRRSITFDWVNKMMRVRWDDGG
jgi:hypothetical protein